MKKKQWTEEEKVMVRVGLIVIIGANIIFVADFFLLENFLFEALNLRQGMPLLVGFRTWFVSFIASLISAGGMGFIGLLSGVLIKWLSGAVRAIIGRIGSAMQAWRSAGFGFAMITDIALIFVDAILAVLFYRNYASGLVI